MNSNKFQFINNDTTILKRNTFFLDRNRNYISKTERNHHKLSVPIINQNIQQQKNTEEKKKYNLKASLLKKIVKKSNSPNKRYSLKTTNSNYFSEKINIKKGINLNDTSNNNIDNFNKSEKMKKRFSVIADRTKLKLNGINNNNRKSSKQLMVKNNEMNMNKTNGKKLDINPFEIDEEDKMFKIIMIKRKKRKKQKKHKLLFSQDKSLLKVYKKLPYIMNELNKIKKTKKDMSLAKYQKTLLEVGNKVFERDICNKLNQKFYEIRKSVEKKYDYFEELIDSIEEREKKIIKKINTQQNFFKRIMVNNNKSNWIYGMNNKIDFFPKVKFYPTPKTLLNYDQRNNYS